MPVNVAAVEHLVVRGERHDVAASPGVVEIGESGLSEVVGDGV
ncbi:MAG: hypothetical protein NT031_20050 [Planctomycetota bacterium]|nr:hypothetical protein [Planctomycetota bacterium]